MATNHSKLSLQRVHPQTVEHKITVAGKSYLAQLNYVFNDDRGFTGWTCELTDLNDAKRKVRLKGDTMEAALGYAVREAYVRDREEAEHDGEDI